MKATTTRKLRGRIILDGPTGTDALRSFLEKEIRKWIFTKFSYSPSEVSYSLKIEEKRPRPFLSCELEIHVDADVFHGFEISGTAHRGVRECLRRMRQMTKEPRGLQLYSTAAILPS